MLVAILASKRGYAMKYIDVTQHERVQIWSLNNPPMNYMIAPLCRDLLEAIGKAERDENVRVVIVTGGIDGKFVTHYSVDELAAIAADPIECGRVFPRIQ